MSEQEGSADCESSCGRLDGGQRHGGTVGGGGGGGSVRVDPRDLSVDIMSSGTVYTVVSSSHHHMSCGIRYRKMPVLDGP